ncbi:MAG TPA: hypothetical protein VFZ32_19020 [Micromonosporaceae bacterium]
MSDRATMASDLALSPGSTMKTFVVEAHVNASEDYLFELAGKRNVERTDDAFLFRVHTDDGNFWVDQLNTRFWSFHTGMAAGKAATSINRWVASRTDLDWMWLPSEHLRHIWPGVRARRVKTNFSGQALLGNGSVDTEDLKVQLSGRNAEALLDYISQSNEFRSAVSFDGVETILSDPDSGRIREAVHRMGRFAVSGDSFELHQQFVRTVVARYNNFITLCEENAISWQSFGSEEGGGKFAGGPVVLRFSRPIPDRTAFLDELFSCRVPFRLWGVPSISNDGVAEVEAVDLHVGQKLRMDIGDSWLRVYFEAGGCGNTIARLVSNLQHRFDAALTLVNPVLGEAVGKHPVSSST